MKISIQNKLKKRYILLRPLKVLLTKTLQTALILEKLTIPVQVSITLVENDEIRRINHEFREQDSITDVLSFPMMEMQDGKFITQPDAVDMIEGALFLGDIVISVPKALEQAEAYGHSVEREMAFLTIHGFLHLLGYDHEQPDREKMMRSRQEDILSRAGLSRNSQ